MKNKRSIVKSAALIFLASILLTMLVAFLVSRVIIDQLYINQRWLVFEGISESIEGTIDNYPSHEWVFSYLLDHLDDELDLDYEECEEAREKERDFVSRHNNQPLIGFTQEQVESFSEEDQKRFAELVYNQWIVRMNDLLQRFGFSYLSIFASDDTAAEKIFLLSASDGQCERGTGKDDAFLFATRMENDEQQKSELQVILSGEDKYSHYDAAGHLSFYSKILQSGDKSIIITGTTSNADTASKMNRGLVIIVGILALLQAISATLCMVMFYHFILKPIRSMSRSVVEYSRSKETEKSKEALSRIRSRNEIGELAADFSNMIDEVDAHINEVQRITAEKERINAELSVATRVQAGLLPRTFPPFPDKKEFDIYASMDPAKEVGGDFYDFFMPDDKHVAMVIADVSDKGIPAAMFMATSKAFIRNRTLMGGKPSEILYDVNNQLSADNMGEMFVTVWLAIIDIETGQGLEANAGHEHPALRRAGGSFELIKYPHSPMLAVMKGLKFSDHEFVLHPGDRLVVYTDGIPEATDQNEELYGFVRMMESFDRNKDLTLEEFQAGVKRDIESFVGEAEQFDDITMLVFDMKDKNQK
jgi:serine phosphatase RsbU (regulator of sigma subunit)